MQTTRPDPWFRWADGATAQVEEPPDGKKDVGWTPDEEPPAEFENGLQNRSQLCLEYLETKTRWGFPAKWTGPGVTTTGAVAPGWFADAESNCTVGSVDAVQGPGPWPSLRLQCSDTTAGNRAAAFPHFSSGQMLIEDPDDTVFVMDAYVVADGGDIDIYLGLHGDPDTSVADPSDGTAFDFAMFSLESGDTNWQCEAGDGAAKTANDSGVAASNDSVTWQRLEMQYHGVNTPVGVANSSATVIFKIAGVTVSTITGANVPTTADGQLTPFFFLQGDGTASGSGDAWIGQCEIVAKHKDYE